MSRSDRRRRLDRAWRIYPWACAVVLSLWLVTLVLAVIGQ